jgi:hypothetical protein
MSKKNNIAIAVLEKELHPKKRTLMNGETVADTAHYVGPFKRHYVERVVALAEHAAAYHTFDMDEQSEYLFGLR